jgi:hypothetical protein
MTEDEYYDLKAGIALFGKIRGERESTKLFLTGLTRGIL